MSLDVSQGLNSLTSLTQNLFDISKGGLEQHSVIAVLKLAEHMRSTAQVCEQLYRYTEEILTAKLVSEEQRSIVQKSQTQLLQLVNYCQGKGHDPYSVKKLWSDLNQWRAQFEKILRQIDDLETRHAVQQECQQLQQHTQALQHQAICAQLEDQRKLELLRHLIELEKSLTAIEQSLQNDRLGHEDRAKLDGVRRAIEDVRLTYGLK
jgi:hypothetical protein